MIELKIDKLLDANTSNNHIVETNIDQNPFKTTWNEYSNKNKVLSFIIAPMTKGLFKESIIGLIQ